MAGFRRSGALFTAIGSVALLSATALHAADHAGTIPDTQVNALDGHAVMLPRDLPPATVLILGFTRGSADATTAWEKPTRAQWAHTPAVTFYDMAMLASVPRFARGFALRSMRKAVPDVLKPNFLTLFDHEAEWKQATGFDAHQEDAAYILLVDRTGAIRWSTHQPFSPALFAQLTEAAQTLAKKGSART